uniref:Uncharacterized protein n=1 Tax=Populus trichocarpa TaxID=3694 RepID=A0A2K1Z3V9_POPTR
MNSCAWRFDLNLISGLLVLPETILLRCCSAKSNSLLYNATSKRCWVGSVLVLGSGVKLLSNVMVSLKPLQTASG